MSSPQSGTVPASTASKRSRLERLRPRRWRASALFLVVVVVVGTAGAGYLWLRDNGRRQVWVASADLPAYRQFSRADVRLAWVRTGKLPRDSLTNDAVVLGRYSLTAARRGKPLSAADVGPELPGGSLQGRSVVSLPASAADIGGALVARWPHQRSSIEHCQREAAQRSTKRRNSARRASTR